MEEHPIEGLMITAMNSIREMIDVNTIIGEPIEAGNNITIIPISKVSFGFAAGGSEFKGETIDEYKKIDKEEEIQYKLPFGGGSGTGACINPIAFLVVQNGNVKLLPVNHSSAVDKLLDYIPDLMEKVNSMLNKNMQNKKEERNKEYQNKIRQNKNERNDYKIKNKNNKKYEPKNINISYEYNKNDNSPDKIDIEEKFFSEDDE